MRGKTINMTEARKHLSRLIARIERGERIVIARAGEPVAELRPVRKMKRRSIPLHDPLLRVDEYSYDGPIGPTANRDIDGTVCGVYPSLRGKSSSLHSSRRRAAADVPR